MTQTLLYEISGISNFVFGYGASTIIPFFFLFIMFVWQLRTASFNFPIAMTLLALFPALTPSITEALGYRHFTMLNYDLQQDETLKIAATFLICIFCASVIIGSALPNNIKISGTKQRYVLGIAPLIVLLVVIFFLMLMFLESGSILTQSYGSIKLENESPYSSLVNQFFNVCVSVFLCYTLGTSRRRIIVVFYVVMIITLLLYSRRTLVISLLIISIYSFNMKTVSVKQLAFLSLGILILMFIGEARSVGIVNYLQGARSANSVEWFFSLPGGASNVFVGTMGVIHMSGRDLLSFPETMPIVLWPMEIYEASIYRNLNYAYNGGMHIANVLYWNFGIFGVILGGLGLGWIAMRVHKIASTVNEEYRGTLPAMLSFAFILTMPNLIWYHPIGTIKLSIAVIAAYCILSVVARATRQDIRARLASPHAHR